ncbi:MAG: oligosaccharide flippase family protein [Fervidobacterium sp.]
MSRAKLFLENFFAYGFVNILNKIVPLILLPVVTRLLPDTSAFGIFDMYNVIVGFATPLAVLGLYDAMFREFFEKDDQQYKYNVTATAERIVFLSSVTITLILLLFSKPFSAMFFSSDNYKDIVVYSGVALIFSANVSIIQAPTRMLNKRRIYVISGLLQSLGYYMFAILLIKLGFSYYGLIYANILTTVALLMFFWFQNKKFFLDGTFDKNIAKELFKIGLPLVPTFLIYWIYNSTDRIMITNMLGTAQLGIYSIGSRLAQISQLIYTAFAGGWQYFAFSTMRDEDQVDLVSRVFEYLGIISFVAFLAIVPFNNFIFSLLFEGDYIKGSTVFPYLFLSPLLLMLFQTAGNQFIVIKKSYLSTISLAVGAGSNVLLNFLLIPKFGIVGASIATLAGYTMSVVMVAIITQKMGLFKLKLRFVLSSFLVALDFVIMQLQLGNLYLVNISMIIFILFIYKDDLRAILLRALSKSNS